MFQITKKNVSISVLTLLIAVATATPAPTAEELLRRVDNNEVYNTIEYEGEMIIEHNNRRFVKTMKAWGRGNTHSFIEFLNPEDRGTRYLRRDGRLFVFSPDMEDVMLISGHMLRESMMGSDMSYEDAINNEPLADRYDAVIAGSETLNGREAWVLDLTARRRTESYPKRKLWIDKENGDLLRYELFALSGARLKEFNLLRAEVIDGRRFPVESEVRDLLRRNSKTTFIMRNVVLDKPLPDAIFSQRNLKR
ncbi:MAG: outer membrane lipoprotein-sorting protein [Chitinispirillales bacterium]|jgi:negative regulator of sigma E activity|nr:outer membrane lipoprotein-sorting protein [Chitinispirillales bacterium]